MSDVRGTCENRRMTQMEKVAELRAISERLRVLALTERQRDADRPTSALLINVVGVLNCTALMLMQQVSK